MPPCTARATLDAIAAQIADVLTAMQADAGQPLCELLADGGASSNDFLVQLQADILNRPVQRAGVEEVGALGAAAMGQPMTPASTKTSRFEPQGAPAGLLDNWHKALATPVFDATRPIRTPTTSLHIRPTSRMEPSWPMAASSRPPIKENGCGGSVVLRAGCGVDRADGSLCHCPEAGVTAMFEAVLGLIVAIALGIYLIITLIAPEKF